MTRPTQELLEEVQRAIAAQDSAAQVRTIRALGSSAHSGALDTLLSLLTARQPAIRAEAAGALQHLFAPQAVQPLVRALSDPESAVRARAAAALSFLGDRRAAEERPKMGVQRTNEVARAVEDHHVADLLIAALDDASAEVRAWAALGLGRLDVASAVDLLIHLLRTDDDSKVKMLAAQALSRVGDARAVEPLIDLLSDPDEWVRFEAVRALGLLGDQRASDPLVRLLDVDPQQHHWIAEALAKLGDRRAYALLIEILLHDGNASHRYLAASALGDLGDVRAFEPLVQASVMRALGALGDVRAVPYLIDGLGDERTVLIAAVNCLRRFEAAPLDLLLPGLTHPQSVVRSWVAWELGVRGDKDACDQVARALDRAETDAEQIRIAAALAQLGDGRAYEPLQPGLVSPSPVIRAIAARGLGLLGDQRASPSLVVALQDPDTDVRHHAVNALAAVGDRDALLSLLTLQSNDSGVSHDGTPIKQSAGQAIARITERHSD